MAQQLAGKNKKISDFQKNFETYGYLETNKFEVVIYPPTGIKIFSQIGAGNDVLWNQDKSDSLSIRAESVNLAGRNISSFDETNIYGPVKQVPTGVTYAEDINITFIASEIMMERDFFESWQQLIFDPSTWDLHYYRDFIGIIEIYTITRGNPGQKEYIRTYGIRCEEVWPKTIGPSELSNASGNELIKIPVNFAFRYWDRIDTGYVRPSAQEVQSRQQGSAAVR